LKATTVVFTNEVCSTFTAMSSLTLLSNHVFLTLNYAWQKMRTVSVTTQAEVLQSALMI
jgi:hypothetical protein